MVCHVLILVLPYQYDLFARRTEVCCMLCVDSSFAMSVELAYL